MFDALEQFLRCAARLEADAADGYDTLYHRLDDRLHHRPSSETDRRVHAEVQELFRSFARFSRMHLNDVLAIQRRELAREYPVDDDRYVWPDGFSPENPLAVVELDEITPLKALEYALEIERRACDFYAHVAGSTRSAQVQELAQEFAEEEAEHVTELQRWIERHRAGHDADGESQ